MSSPTYKTRVRLYLNVSTSFRSWEDRVDLVKQTALNHVWDAMAPIALPDGRSDIDEGRQEYPKWRCPRVGLSCYLT